MLPEPSPALLLEGLAALPFLALSALGLNLFILWTIGQLQARRGPGTPLPPLPAEGALPAVLVQLPVYNEPAVIGRLLAAIAGLDWPRDRLRIQLLDDSTDGSETESAARVEELRARGYRITHIRRGTRTEFKAGALANGLQLDDSAFVAIFDADFIPPPHFLRKAMAPLLAGPNLAFAQARWEHLNAAENALTAAQAMMIDAHFVVEQRVRSWTSLVLPFNGTCGVWRRTAIDDAGGWSGDTLCEDLDLSIRARLRGWDAVFLPDLAAPGEIPATFSGWRAQQFRWTKGFAQVARKMLLPVWASDLPLFAKFALTMQTLQTACYPLSALSIIASIGILLDKTHGQLLLSRLGGAVTVLGIGGSALCLATAALVLNRRNWLRFPFLFVATLVLNMGLVISNTRAVAEAVLGRRSQFVRTPKRGEAGAARHDLGGPTGAAEILFGTGTALILAREVGWLSPMFSLSIIGLILVGAGLARERWLALARRSVSWQRKSGVRTKHDPDQPIPIYWPPAKQ